jgi:recombination protein RecT
MECAQLRLEPSVNGDCWILPYAGVAKLIIGYRGMAKLAYRSSLVASVNAAVVYEGDEFRYSLGTEAGIHHIPSGQTDPNRITHAYAVIRTTLGGVVFRVLTRAEIDEARKRSPSGTQPGGPWAQHYAEMAMKTAVRRVSKLGPCDADMARAIDLDEAGESGRPQSLEMSLPEDFIDAESSEPEPNLGARLEAQSAREGGGA